MQERQEKTLINGRCTDDHACESWSYPKKGAHWK